MFIACSVDLTNACSLKKYHIILVACFKCREILSLVDGIGHVQWRTMKIAIISRHTVVCRAAQENGAHANGSEYC